jgi:hypothetical protein
MGILYTTEVQANELGTERRLTMRRIVMLIVASVFLLLVPGRAWGDTLVLRDGTRVSGVLVSATARTITFKDTHGVSHRYTTKQVQAVEFTSASQGSTGASRNGRKLEVLPRGTELVVRTNETIDSKTAAENQTFSAELDQDVVGGSGRVVVPKGSPAQLIIRSASSGGVTGSPEMVLDIQSITVAGRRYLISTADLKEKSDSGIGANKRTAEMIGGGAVIGTIIGAVVGHGKGAAIGAAVGAAGGAGAQVLTKGKEVRVPAETVLRFSLDQAVSLAAER